MTRIKSVFAFFVVLLLALPAWAQLAAAQGEGAPNQPVPPTVNLRYGSLTLSGVFQTRLEFKVPASELDDATLGFSVQRVRLILSGHVLTEGLGYFFQGDAANANGSFVLDAGLSYGFTNGLSIKVGRFVPDFSLMMPRSTADLGTIDYPLYLTAGNFSIWRQIGIQASMRPTPLVSFVLGVFNGMFVEPTATYRMGGVANALRLYMPLSNDPTGVQNLGDNNNLKDFLFRVNLHLSNVLTVGLHTWFGFPRAYTMTQSADGTSLLWGAWAADRNTTDFVIQGGLSGEYRTPTLHIAGEVMMRQVSFDEAKPTSVAGLTDESQRIDSLMSLGAWLHFGYLYQGWLEGVLRFDWLEPAMDEAFDTDQVMRVTVGPQFWLEDGNHFRILVNYFTDVYYQNENRDPDHNVQAQFVAWW